MTELAYFTADQLINELLTRKTFCGMLIRSAKEVKGRELHQLWYLDTTPNLTNKQIHEVLTEITEQLGEKLIY